MVKMGQTIKVDYNSIPSVLDSIRSNAHDLNTELTNMFQKLTDMHNSWRGVRYATVTKRFDDCVPDLNSILQLVVTEIPTSLETIYNNYVAFENETSAKPATEESPNNINVIGASADETLYFVDAEVMSVKDAVQKSIKNSKDLMNSMDTRINSFTWESESATEYKSKLRETKDKINTAFDDIDSLFTSQMQAASDNATNLENANKGA